jgi:hypothetical protein
MTPGHSPSHVPQSTVLSDTAQLHAIWLHLQAREQAVAEKADALRIEERHQTAMRAVRKQELSGLETRVQNQRRQLAVLQEQTVQAESAATGEFPVAELVEPRPAILLPWAATKLVGDLKIALADVADQQQIVAEQQARMQEVKQLWTSDWQASLAALARRETDLDVRSNEVARREREVATRERRLRDRSVDLIRQEQALRCEEVRVRTAQNQQRGERGRLLAVVRSRAAVNRARAAYLGRLQKRRDLEHQEELARQVEMRTACESDRRDLMRLRLALQKQQAELSNRARYLLERELVLTQAQQQLLAGDPNPSGAEAELQRRLAHLHEIGERPLRGIERREQELEVRHEELEQFRAALLEDQHWLEEEKANRLRLQHTLQSQHAELENRRMKWSQRLRGLRSQRNHLLRQVRELREQLERLSVLMLGEEQQEVRLAA